PLLDRPTLRSLNRVGDVFRFNVKTIDVVEPAVPSLGHHGETPGETFRVRAAVSETPGNHGVTGDSDAVGVGEHDRAFQKSALLHPGSAGHFTVAIEREIAGEDGMIHGSATTG